MEVVDAGDNDREAWCMARMRREVRAWLAASLYHDVDMANAQPALALQLMERYEVEAPALREYVTRREARLREVQEACEVGRDAAKELFLRVCFGGSCEEWARVVAAERGGSGGVGYGGVPRLPDFPQQLQMELRDAVKALLDVHPQGGAARAVARQQGKPRTDLTAFALLTQDAERRCVEALLAAVQASGRRVGALIYDGLLVRRQMCGGVRGGGGEGESGEGTADGVVAAEAIEKLPAALLRGWEAAVETATGFAVRLEEKAWVLNPDLVGARVPAGADVAAVAIPPLEGAPARLEQLGLLEPGASWLPLPDDLSMDALAAESSKEWQDALGGCTVVRDAGYLRHPSAPPAAADGEEGDAKFTMYALVGGEGLADRLLGIEHGSLRVTVDGKEAGFLPRLPEPFAADIGGLHRTLALGLQWTVLRPGGSMLLFNGYDKDTYAALKDRAAYKFQIRMSHPDDGSGGALCSAKVHSADGRQLGDLDRRRGLPELHNVYRAVLSAVRDARGITPHANYVFNFTRCFTNTTNNNNSVINNNNNGGIRASDADTDIDVVRVRLLEDARTRRLRKADGVVYEPVPGRPCAFRPLDAYEKHINKVLKGEAAYYRTPRRFEEMMKFMRNYTELDEFPELERDVNLLSFSNGVLAVDTMEFVPYGDDGGSDEEAPPSLRGRVARHHIEAPYTGSDATPMLDKILDAQEFAPEVAELLCAMLGRLLFPLNAHDGWQVMLYLVGVGGTGKSLLLNVVRGLVAPGTVGTIGGRREEVFGQANLADKDLVLGMDMPAKLSQALPQEAMQSMVSGEDMEVPRKGQTALHVTWKAPIALASNHMPDYVNTGNNVGRRLVVFNFARVVANPQEDLVARIKETELPNVACRILRAYHAFRAKAAAAGGFWCAVPEQVLEWQSSLAAATNGLYRFLAMDDDERGYAVERVEGHVTWLLDFKAAFKDRMGQAFENDSAVMQKFGFTVSSKKENVCLSCKQLAKGGKARCCEQYSNATNRAKKDVIYGMRMAHACTTTELWRGA
jgi:transposase